MNDHLICATLDTSIKIGDYDEVHKRYCSVRVQILQHSIDMNIDHLINVLFQSTSIEMSEYQEVHNKNTLQ